MTGIGLFVLVLSHLLRRCLGSSDEKMKGGEWTTLDLFCGVGTLTGLLLMLIGVSVWLFKVMP